MRVHLCMHMYMYTLYYMYINLRLDMDTYMYMCNFANSGTSKKTSRNLRRSHHLLHVFATSANHFPHLSCFILHVWNT